MAAPEWYKWVILTTTCLSTFAAFGYVISSTSIVTIFYIQHYDERIISAIISPAQLGILQFTCLPALYLGKKFGNRIIQIIGSLVLSASIALTALTTASWQGLLLSGVCAGIGGGLMQIATTKTIKEYFPGRQIGPFGAISLTLNLASMVVPQAWTSLMHTLGWTKTLITVGAILLINFLCGLSYINPGEVSEITEDTTGGRPKLSLVPGNSSSGMFLVDQEVIARDVQRKTSVDIKLEGIQISDLGYADLDIANSANGDVKLAEEDEDKPEDSRSDGSSMWQTMKMPQSIALVVMSGLYSGGLTACFTVMGDYALRSLDMSDEQVANALTLMGGLQIVASLIYICLTVCTEFSATLLHTVCMFCLSASILAMAFIKSSVWYFILVGSIGFFKAFTSGNSVPLSIELTSPEQAMNLYVMKCLCDGLGSAGMPFIAVYIQETINEQAALYLGGAALFCSGSIFLPFIKRFLFKQRVKEGSEVTRDNISTVNYAYTYM